MSARTALRTSPKFMLYGERDEDDRGGGAAHAGSTRPEDCPIVGPGPAADKGDAPGTRTYRRGTDRDQSFGYRPRPKKSWTPGARPRNSRTRARRPFSRAGDRH